ncbi:hypothetical protein THRCLA_03126 [Thraustotheca clavata]|uniref:WW domain-containing protein n=1 Tax=Thraustotheca clavata TaxID=74557 RepID=A0A1W0A309_9STRA|nr:hypothetical protein THRCLA_03126 [Thraustotheca clavata]
MNDENPADESFLSNENEKPIEVKTPMQIFMEMLDTVQEQWIAKLYKFESRLDNIRQSTMIVRTRMVKKQTTIDQLQTQLHDAHLKSKNLLMKWTKEKDARHAEKEWIAEVWPTEFILPPTILRPFIKDLPPTLEEIKARENHAAMQLQLMVEAEQIVTRMTQALQWTAIDNYYYNSITGESVWEKPAIMSYEPPYGWDKKKMQWREGVVLTLFTDVQPQYSTSIVPIADTFIKMDEAPVEEHDDGEDSDSETQRLDPIELRKEFVTKKESFEKSEMQLKVDRVTLETISQKLEKAVAYQLRAEAKAIDDEAQAYIAAERKKIAKKNRELAALQAEAQAKLDAEKEKKSGRKSPPKTAVTAKEFEKEFEIDIQVPVDPNRLRLCTPTSTINDVKLHKVDDEAYIHMHTLQEQIAAFVAEEDALWEKHDSFRELVEVKVKDTKLLVEKLAARREELIIKIEEGKITAEELKLPLPRPQLMPNDPDDGRSRFDVYDEEMSTWDTQQATRLQESTILDQNLIDWCFELEHQPTELTKQDLVFYEAVEKAEIERGASLWTKKLEYLVWRTRSLIDRTTREERLHELENELVKYQEHLKAARRIPLQAMNVFEKAKLLTLCDEQVEYYTLKVNSTSEEISNLKNGLSELMKYELHALDFHTKRLKEECALHQESQTLWDDQEQELAQILALEAVNLALKKVAMPITIAPSFGVLDLQRKVILLNYTRERRWRTLALLERTDETIWLEAEDWLINQLKARYEVKIRHLKEKHAIEIYNLDEMIDGLRAELDIAKRQKLSVETEKATILNMLANVDKIVDKTKIETMQVLKEEIAKLEAKLSNQQVMYESRIEELVLKHTTTRQELEQRLESTLADAVLRMQWLKAVKCELSDHKVLNEHLLAGIAALEKRRAAEINDMQARIVSQLSRIHRLEMWNMSLKQCIEDNNDLMLKFQRDLEAKIQEHRQDQRQLRREIWHQRVSVQMLLANANHLVRFFFQGIAQLCGHANDALRESSVIPILVSLCKSPGVPEDLRALATSSLGKVAWNQPKSKRYVGWQAKTMWHSWVQRLTKEAYSALEEAKCDEFDSFIDPTSDAMNVSADPREHEKYQSHLDRLDILRQVKQWPHLPTPNDTSVNEVNLLTIGDTDGALTVLLHLCEESQPIAVRENALASIAILAMHSRNTHIMGRTPAFLKQLLALCQDTTHPTLQVHAIHSIANIAYKNNTNQAAIQSLGGIAILLKCVMEQKDVDVLDVSTAALASLTMQNEVIAAVLMAPIEGKGSGLLQLLQLAHQPYINDAVEDNKMDCIQGNIAMCLVHVMECHTSGFQALCKSAPEVYGNLCLQLCGSPFTTVQLAAVVVIGHLAQEDTLRAWIGDNDGVATLFSFISPEESTEMLEHVTWSLIQLSWNRDNQTRLAFYWKELYQLASSSESQFNKLKTNALCIVANVLFYNPENRQDIINYGAWINLFVELCMIYTKDPLSIDQNQVEHVIRSLCALSYDPKFATDCDHLIICIGVLKESLNSKEQRTVIDLQQHALQWLTNLCVFDRQKSIFAHSNEATETIVALCGVHNRHVRDKAQTILDLVNNTRCGR